MPGAGIGLSVAVVIGTLIRAGGEGQVVIFKEIHRKRQKKYSTKQLVMWWLLSTAVSLILTFVLDNVGLFLVTVFVFLLGGLGVCLHLSSGNPPGGEYVDSDFEGYHHH